MSVSCPYSIDDLARRSGTSVRTIRYYVQEGVIDPPRGRGRGHHFDDEHLDQLMRVRLLQLAGFNLAAIKAKGADLLTITKKLNAQGLFALEALSLLTQEERSQEPPQRAGGSTDIITIPLADGIDLSVNSERQIPSPKELVEIALLVRKVFGENY